MPASSRPLKQPRLHQGRWQSGLSHTSLTAKALQSRGDSLTFASFCSFLMTASLYIWLSLAPKYPGPLPFLFGDSSTFSLLSAGALWMHLGFQLSTGKRFRDYKMSLWKLHHFSNMRGHQYSYEAGKPLLKQKNPLHFCSFFLKVSL